MSKGNGKAQYEDELQLLEIGQMDEGSFSNDGRASMPFMVSLHCSEGLNAKAEDILMDR